MAWFLELAGRRTYSDGAPNPIGFQDIESWARLTGRRPSPWHVAALVRMDSEWIAKADRERAEALDPDKANRIKIEDTAALAAFLKSQPGRDVAPVTRTNGKPAHG